VRLQPWKDDNKALIVSWETAQLSSPEGPVSSYEVEYRDGEQGLPNRVRVPPEAPYFIIYGVENDENYEVRVAILVEVSPLKLNRSQWTDWAGVNDTKSQGGEVQPTTEKGEVKPANNRGILSMCISSPFWVAQTSLYCIPKSTFMQGQKQFMLFMCLSLP
jgi:hypothetical protein